MSFVISCFISFFSSCFTINNSPGLMLSASHSLKTVRSDGDLFPVSIRLTRFFDKSADSAKSSWERLFFFLSSTRRFIKSMFILCIFVCAMCVFSVTFCVATTSFCAIIRICFSNKYDSEGQNSKWKRKTAK